VNEAIGVIKRLFTEEVVEHQGEFFRFQPVKFQPKPVQKPWPPMLIGGDAPAAIRRAAQHGDGWLPMAQTVETLGANLKKIEQLRAEAGRTGPFDITVQFNEAPSLGDLKRYRDLGVDRVIMPIWNHPREAVESMMISDVRAALSSARFTSALTIAIARTPLRSTPCHCPLVTFHAIIASRPVVTTSPL